MILGTLKNPVINTLTEETFVTLENIPENPPHLEKLGITISYNVMICTSNFKSILLLLLKSLTIKKKAYMFIVSFSRWD